LTKTGSQQTTCVLCSRINKSRAQLCSRTLLLPIFDCQRTVGQLAPIY